MVSFRYHLTSLAATLLALAVGIVVGTTSLSAEPAPTVVPTPAMTPAMTPGDSAAEELATRLEQRVLRNALPGQKVLLLQAPDAPEGSARAAVTALKAAGATVTAQVHVLPALLDASGAETVTGVVAGTAPATLPLPTGALPRAGTLLASALVTSDQGTDLRGLAQQKVLGGFTGGSLLSFEGPPPTTPATLVLLLAGPARGAALASLAAAFEARVGTVVAAPVAAAQDRGVVEVLRSTKSGVSDVDGLGTATAAVGTVLALGEQAAGGSGHYGTGPGADAVVPSSG